MSPDEFEDYLVTLSDEEYTILMNARIAKLNPEQQLIAQAREVIRKERFRLISSMKDGTSWEDVRESFATLGEGYTGECEHGRSYCKHCVACGEIDYLMFPEIFNENGFRIDTYIEGDEKEDCDEPLG